MEEMKIMKGMGIMTDSINFIIRNVEELDFKNICKITQGKIKHYTKRNKTAGYENSCYSFNYKGIEFKYNSNLKLVTILANAHEVLNIRDIKESDINEYEERVHQTVSEVLNTDNFKIELSRIDYCVDVPLTEDEIKAYLFLLEYNTDKFKYMKKKKVYATSVCMGTKRGMRNLRIYDRGAKTGKQEDQNILRIELQCKPKLIKSEYNKYGIDRALDNYWSEQAMQEYYFDVLSDYFYEGDYYTRDKAYKIINESNHTEKSKNKLKKFLRDVENNTLAGLISDKKYSSQLVRNRIKKLNKLFINPTPIPRLIAESRNIEHLENLLTRARRIAEENYFDM